MYFLCTASGETRWLFETGDAVKSSPAVDPLTGLVIVGSHDGHVYALNPKVSVFTIRRQKGFRDVEQRFPTLVLRDPCPDCFLTVAALLSAFN